MLSDEDIAVRLDQLNTQFFALACLEIQNTAWDLATHPRPAKALEAYRNAIEVMISHRKDMPERKANAIREEYETLISTIEATAEGIRTLPRG